jgi:hypothetical protein
MTVVRRGPLASPFQWAAESVLLLKATNCSMPSSEVMTWFRTVVS